MEREEKPLCNAVGFYAKGTLVQMSDLMAVIPSEILYLEEDCAFLSSQQAAIFV